MNNAFLEYDKKVIKEHIKKVDGKISRFINIRAKWVGKLAKMGG